MSTGGLVTGPNFLKELTEIGHAILAEIYRLADFVPTDFKDPANSRFKPFLVDFAYFEDLSIIDRFVDSNELGVQLEEEYLFTFEIVIKRYGALFDAITHFFTDLIEYSEEIRKDKIVTLPVIRTTAFLTIAQQEAEALYIAGLILLALDEKFTCETRQRLFIAHYRSNASSSERFDIMIDVLKKASNREELFGRLPISKNFVNDVLMALRTDVLFTVETAVWNYELPVRGGLRAARIQRVFLALCLYFAPSMLHSDFVTMRQIVDNFFAEEWVIHLHMGMIMNVYDAWDRFKAASTALQHALAAGRAKQLVAAHVASLRSATFPLVTKLSAAELISSASAIAVYNRHLEWIILHSYKLECCKRASQLYDAVSSQLVSSSLNLFDEVLSIAVFEYGFKETASALLSNKKEHVEMLKSELRQHIIQVAELFANESPLHKIKKNEKLRSWLLLVEKTVADLDVTNPETPSHINDLKIRLEQVIDMHDLSAIVTVSQYFQIINALLVTLSHYCVLDDTFLPKLESVTNFAYGWSIIDQWTDQMENLVKKDPLPVRSLFIKLAGSIKITLNHLKTPERISSISLCYSSQLEERLRKILQVAANLESYSGSGNFLKLELGFFKAVPRSLFLLLDRVSELLDPPNGCFVKKTEVRRFADPERRLQLAETTHKISMLSRGISTMQLSYLGSVKVDPSTLLLDGIRRELVAQICANLHGHLAIGLQLDELLAKMKHKFIHFRGAFIYMCEHIAVNGAVVWHNELSRVLGYMVEKECNLFLRHPIGDHESLFQSRSAPIPNTRTADGSLTPLYCLYCVILKTTDPKTTYYVNSTGIWCDMKTKRTVFSNESLNIVQEALSPVALWAMDRISSFHIVKHLYTLCDHFTSITCPVMISLLNDIASVDSTVITTRSKIFESASARFLPNSSRFTATVSKIGQLQLLRKQIVSVNQLAIRQCSSAIFEAIATLNEGLMNDIRSRRGECDETLLKSLSELLQRCTISDPFAKVMPSLKNCTTLP